MADDQRTQNGAKQAESLGCIKVKVVQGKRLPSTKKLSTANETLFEKKEISEKEVKGRAISHAVESV